MIAEDAKRRAVGEIEDVIGKLKTHAEMATGRPINEASLRLLPSVEQCQQLADRLGAALVELGKTRAALGTRSLQRMVRSPSRRADENAWDFVKRMKEEWTYEDWEDFYEGIKGAMEKIAARHRAPNDKVSERP